MAGVAFGPSANAGQQERAFERGHATVPLRSGCLSHAYSIGDLHQRDFLYQCMYECTQLPGCGAVAFLRIAAYYSPLGAVEKLAGAAFCRFHHANCTARAKPGPCVGGYRQESKKGWCVHMLARPSATCRAPRVSTLPLLQAAVPTAPADSVLTPTEHASTTLVRYADLQHTTDSRPNLVHCRAYTRLRNGTLSEDVILGGGINNMLMHIAQLLTSSCEGKMVLVLPLLAADPLGDNRGGYNATMRFSQLFDWRNFVDRMSPCQLTEELPPGGVQVNRVELISLRDRPEWDGKQSRFIPMLSRIYSALAPSAEVGRLVSALVTHAVQLAGSRWAAVHLPVERDWWWVSDFCRPRSTELWGRRCFSPLEVSRAIDGTLRSVRSSGTVLLYAPDKVHVDGPPVCMEGPNAVKLLLPAEIPYTVRNAAEQFFAVASPAGFFGNSYSTFSKGVAIMRHWAGARGGLPNHAVHSFAYDCAKPVSPWWPISNPHITLAHPGFEFLQTLPDHRRTCQPPGTKDARELTAARERQVLRRRKKKRVLARTLPEMIRQPNFTALLRSAR